MLKKAIFISLGVIFTLSFSIYFFVFKGINQIIEDKIASKKPLILLFSASWCGSCNKQKPILNKVLANYKEIYYFEIGSDLNKVRKKILFKKYKVKGIPTLVFFKEGKELQRLTGVQTQKDLEKSFSALKEKQSSTD